MNIQEEIGQKLKTLREERNLTQPAVGKVLGVSGSAISNKEKGKSDINLNEIASLAEFYGVSVGWLFGEATGGGYGPEEERLLRLYHGADDSGKADILKIAIDAYLEKR